MGRFRIRLYEDHALRADRSGDRPLAFATLDKSIEFPALSASVLGQYKIAAHACFQADANVRFGSKPDAPTSSRSGECPRL